ncbi:MAG: PASTA domain-containing protein [Coriobacteriia bacterium]|nr:PASTA domain-containing protein [Coriobacteriia bacterium]
MVQNVLIGKRYRIVEKIGSGGMADVYKAVDETLGRTVAVKLMHSQLTHDPSFTARFQQEAKAAANLQSPYIVNIYDWGAETLADGNTLYYIVMEYVRGEDLKSIIKRSGALPSGKVAEIGALICAALSTAHGYDIIHRDIKPHNIMVLPDGNIKVMDFGIARAGNTQMTQTGSVLGSAHYVSPEQAQGRDLGAASDLYSLGVVMYEASTGRLPFDGDSPVATALKQVQEQAVRPKSLNPNIDPQLEEVIGYAMAKDPRARYATADAMRRDLIRVVKGEPILGAHGTDNDATSVLGAAGAGAGAMAPLGGRRDPADVEGTTVMPAVDAGAATTAGAVGTGRTVDPAEKKNNKVFIWVGVVLAVLVAAGIIAWQLGLFDAPPEEPIIVKMPNLVNMTEEAAREKLIDDRIAIIVPADGVDGEAGTAAGAAGGAAADLAADATTALTPAEPNPELISVQEEFSPTVPEGYVISHTPEADTELADPANTAVTLVISKGEENFMVPDLEGLTLAEARTAVAEYSFEIESTEENHDEVPAGQIISQSPAAGEERAGGSTIRVIISAGVANVDVPNVRTMTRQQATTTLQNLGLRVNITERSSADVSEGVVMDQNPRQGASMARGSTVELTVSSGPELIAVPNVLNMSEDAATAAITSAGLRVRVINAAGEFGLVIAQDPRAGQRVAANTQITITVGTGVGSPE